MSRKRRERMELAKRRSQRRMYRFIALAALVCLVPLVVKLPTLLWTRIDRPRTQEATQRATTYLAGELPSNDEAARRLIRAEYFNFDGFTFYRRESDIPIEHLLVPDRLFSEEERKIISAAITTIGGVSGADDPVFVALKECAERKPNRIIEEILPLDRKLAIRNDHYQFAFDAFWSPELRSIYAGRHQLPYFMLFVSTLYQEAFHAVQLQGRSISLAENAAIEHEAHEAQLAFNQKLRSFIESNSESSRRFRLELDVIDENLRASIEDYDQGLVERTGVTLPK